VGEVGELSEIFQWKGEVAKGLPDWKEEEKVHLGEELSDVLLYLVQLSDACGVDLGKAALRKVQLNAMKYPAPNQQSQTNMINGTQTGWFFDPTFPVFIAWRLVMALILLDFATLLASESDPSDR
jgi:dCTP diphosphatase